MENLNDLKSAIIAGQDVEAKVLVQKAIDSNRNPQDLVHDVLIPAMDEVGQKFESGEYFIPEMLLAARAMKAAMELLQPLLAKSGIKPIAKVVLGTVQGDLHDIGKNLVASMLEGGGFEVHDLGADVSPERFVQAVHDHSPELVGLSALLTTTMPSMGHTLKAFETAGIREKVKVMVGGAPVTIEFSDSIGADGYAESASSAVALARSLLKS